MQSKTKWLMLMAIPLIAQVIVMPFILEYVSDTNVFNYIYRGPFVSMRPYHIFWWAIIFLVFIMVSVTVIKLFKPHKLTLIIIFFGLTAVLGIQMWAWYDAGKRLIMNLSPQYSWNWAAVSIHITNLRAISLFELATSSAIIFTAYRSLDAIFGRRDTTARRVWIKSVLPMHVISFGIWVALIMIYSNIYYTAHQFNDFTFMADPYALIGPLTLLIFASIGLVLQCCKIVFMKVKDEKQSLYERKFTSIIVAVQIVILGYMSHDSIVMYYYNARGNIESEVINRYYDLMTIVPMLTIGLLALVAIIAAVGIAYSKPVNE